MGGPDLLLLAVDEDRRTVHRPEQLGFALAAAEVIELATSHRLEADGDGDGNSVRVRVRVVESLHTGDAILDETLDALKAMLDAAQPGDEPLQPADWIVARAPDRAAAHAAALIESGALRGKVLRTGIGRPAKPFGLEVIDRARRKELISRLAQAADTADPLDRAFGALAQAADLGAHTLGRRDRRVKKRLAELAHWFDSTDEVPTDPRDRLIHLAVSQTVAVAKYYDPAPSKGMGYDYGSDFGAIGKIPGGLTSLQ